VVYPNSYLSNFCLVQVGPLELLLNCFYIFHQIDSHIKNTKILTSYICYVLVCFSFTSELVFI
jgi:hypothetical protein